MKGGLEPSDELAAEDTADYFDGKKEGAAGPPRFCEHVFQRQGPGYCPPTSLEESAMNFVSRKALR